MSHTPHELAADFPGQVEMIHELKLKDGEFRHLFEQYHSVNRAVHRAESLLDPCDVFNEAELRKERMRLKDRIAAKLAKAAERIN